MERRGRCLKVRLLFGNKLVKTKLLHVFFCSVTSQQNHLSTWTEFSVSLDCAAHIKSKKGKFNDFCSSNVKVTDRRFQLPLSLFCLLTFAFAFYWFNFFFSILLLLTFSVALSDTVEKQKTSAFSIRSICGDEEFLCCCCCCCWVMLFSHWVKLGSLFHSLCSLLGTVSVCVRKKQTDSEQTDFAFDGEMTATEVCTSGTGVTFKAWMKDVKCLWEGRTMMKDQRWNEKHSDDFVHVCAASCQSLCCYRFIVNTL